MKDNNIKSMKISMIATSYFPEINGVTISLYERLKCLSALGHNVQLFIPDYGFNRDIYPDYKKYTGEVMPGVSVIPYDTEHVFKASGGICKAKPFSFKKIESEIRLFDPDIIHIEEPERLFLGFLTVPAKGLSRKLGIPITSFYHTNYLQYLSDYKNDVPILNLPNLDILMKKLVVWIYNQYDVTMVNTRVCLDYIKDCGIKNYLLGEYYAIDTNIFNKREPDENIQGKIEKIKDKVKIIYVGRMYPDKQIDTLLDIFDAVRNKTDKCGFIFIGSGPEYDKVKNWSMKNDDTILVGHVPLNETPAYYSNSDIFVTASPRETLGMTVLEAMACGLPVVGPNEGGVGELVKHGKSGYAVKTNDIDDFTEAILKLSNDKELRTKMGDNAVNTVKNYSWLNATNNMLSTWNNVIKSHKLMTKNAQFKSVRAIGNI